MPNGYTFEQLRRCVEREVGFRKRVYGKQVTNGRMTQEKADTEVAMMQAIAEHLKTQEQGSLNL